MNVKEVHHSRWCDIIYLYDGGHRSFSAIWGRVTGNKKRSLGIRWNGHSDEDIGYPNSRGRPVWFDVPEILWYSTLVTLLQKVDNNQADKEMYIENILIALKECQDILGN